MITKKDKQLAEKEIMRLIEKYSPILLLDHIVFRSHYGLENANSLAESVFRYPYLDATINYGDELIGMVKSKKDITNYVIHEMCHTITEPLYSKSISRYVSPGEITDEMERLTDHIANIIFKPIDDNRKVAKTK